MRNEMSRRGLLSAAIQVGAASQLLGQVRAEEVPGQPPAYERRTSFDEGWRFCRGDVPGGQLATFSDRDWDTVDVPHDWSITGPFVEDAPSGGSGGYAPTGIGWYRKTFRLPDTMVGKRVAVQFDGVYQCSEVWVNGQSLGSRPNGYVSFVYDLTSHLRAGGAPNVIAVRVDNSSQPNSRWYSGSGIYRHTWLIVTDPLHIRPWGVYVRATDISNDSATVDVGTRVHNLAGQGTLCTLRTILLDPDGHTVAMADTHAHIKNGSEYLFEQASNQRIAVEQLQKFIHLYDYVSGDFIWTGFDYLGESRWPRRVATAGALDTCGFRKDSFYFYQSLWSKQTVLYLSPHWNWPGKEGQMMSVSCYTNCETVELFLNGKSLGVKGYAFPRPGHVTAWNVYPPRAKALQTTADLHLCWDVPYEPGTLRAVGTTGDQVVATFDVKTSGTPTAIRLSVDRERIKTGPGDVAHVVVEVVDAQGVVVPVADNEIAFDLQGNGKIRSVDNGQPDSNESYQAPRRKVFHGLALVILQSAGAPGTMTLSASSPSLLGATLQVVTET